MSRLLAVALGAWALTLTAPVQGVLQDVEDFREHQRLTGRHIGCQLESAVAAGDGDVERALAVQRRCAKLPPV